MDGSSNKKGNGKKAAEEPVSVEVYPVNNGAFLEPPDKFLDELIASDRILLPAVLFKYDIEYLWKARSEKAAKLITKIRKTEKGLVGRRFVTIREFIKYTHVREEKVLRYLLSVTVYRRILS